MDPAFVADPNGAVNAVVMQPDGKVLIGGKFTTLNGPVNSVPSNRIARLNADGSLDNAFMNGLSGVTATGTSYVVAVTLQPDGKVLIGGDSVGSTV